MCCAAPSSVALLLPLVYDMPAQTMGPYTQGSVAQEAPQDLLRHLAYGTQKGGAEEVRHHVNMM